MFESAAFWGALAATGAVVHLLPVERVRLRAFLVALVSLAVVWRVLDLTPVQLAIVLGAAAWIPVGLGLTRELGRTRPMAAAILAFAPILFLWTAGKVAVPLGWAPGRLVVVVGFSFLLVKAWTTIKDFHDGRIGPVDPAVLFAFVLHFPTYVAGPMHLYGDFDRSLRAPRSLSGEGVVDVVLRILLGLVKIRVLVPLLRPVGLDAMVSAGTHSIPTLVFGGVVYSAVIWADFSGYTDLAIATSRLLGIETPENFRYPYAATNVRDFWQRWHMTFSQALTSYLFVPLTRWLPKVVGDRPRVVMVLGTTLTFLFCGAWHGPTANFLLWGLFHAAGLVAYDLYRPGATRRRLKRGTKGSRAGKLVGRLIATAATFAFVSMGWILFVLPLHALRGLFRW